MNDLTLERRGPTAGCDGRDLDAHVGERRLGQDGDEACEPANGTLDAEELNERAWVAPVREPDGTFRGASVSRRSADGLRAGPWARADSLGVGHAARGDDDRQDEETNDGDDLDLQEALQLSLRVERAGMRGGRTAANQYSSSPKTRVPPTLMSVTVTQRAAMYPAGLGAHEAGQCHRLCRVRTALIGGTPTAEEDALGVAPERDERRSGGQLGRENK